MKLVRDNRGTSREDPYAGTIRVHTTPCYDFLVSLRALFNPRTFRRTRRWGLAARRQFDERLTVLGQFFFQGFDTALGYGGARLIGQLQPNADPVDLVEAIGGADPAALALFMLDTGETSGERLERYERVLAGDGDPAEALRGLPRGWATRCRRVLEEPEIVQAELVALLDTYLTRIYSAQIGQVQEALDAATSASSALLDALPTVEAIEQLTGGYTLATDLDLRSITLAPSIFVYPFMSTRVDERSGEALIIYGVPSDVFDSYDPVPIQRELAKALKALADPNRLMVMGLLAKESMYGTELISALGLSQPTVHYHLTELRSAGLIRQQREKGGMRYSIRRTTAAEIPRALHALILGGASGADGEGWPQGQGERDAKE